MTARHLIDAGRAHVAAGRSREAMRCFALALDDPVVGVEARSLLAAAYLLPGTLRPSLALRHVRRVAAAASVPQEHLARCAAVALHAGDPDLAEELARRAGHHKDALPILATAKVRRGDREGVGRLLAGVDRPSGSTAFWHRLLADTAHRGWRREALSTWWRLRRSRVPVPSLLELLVRGLHPLVLAAALLAGALLALVLPQPVSAVLLAGDLLLAVLAIRVDLHDGRLASALAGGTWMAVAGGVTVAHWLS
ncbi:MAG TPA: hypothetical protein VKG45_06650 [Actinomycetes bacterium]|nr:hypothetical protein [Actinomycetes bacterium]